MSTDSLFETESKRKRKSAAGDFCMAMLLQRAAVVLRDTWREKRHPERQHCYCQGDKSLGAAQPNSMSPQTCDPDKTTHLWADQCGERARKWRRDWKRKEFKWGMLGGIKNVILQWRLHLHPLALIAVYKKGDRDSFLLESRLHTRAIKQNLFSKPFTLFKHKKKGKLGWMRLSSFHPVCIPAKVDNWPV